MEFKTDPLARPEPADQVTAPDVSDTVAYLLYLRTRSHGQLEAMIREIQPRLGTSDEGRYDLDAVQHIAHQLNNLRTCTELENEMGRLEPA